MKSSLIRRLTAVILLVTLCSCQTWHSAELKDIRDGNEERTGIRLYFPDGTVDLRENWILDYPRITGYVKDSEGNVPREPGPPVQQDPKNPLESFDLEKVQRVELLKFNPWATAGAVVVGTVGVLAATIAIVIATKRSSCPYVYVDEGAGQKLVGEGYPGAVFRSIQREDLLALPIRGEGAVKVRLVNWAPETQYTDRLELSLVDHAADQRVIATADARPLLVGASGPPRFARDLEGADCLAAVRSADEVSWSTDLHRVSARNDAPVREGIEAAFAQPGGRPVLELRIKNTKWLEVVFGRFYSMMGDRFASYIKQGNEAPAKEIMEWRQREGVDLRVEALNGSRWETLGYVPATGAVAMRDAAVFFPEDWPVQETVQVRVSGGTGFWRVDSVALSILLDEQPRVERVTPRQSVAMDGTDQLAILAAVDGRYNELANYGDWLEAQFILPPLPEGAARSVFLATNGYYNTHPPAHPDRSLMTLKRIRDEEGGLVRYGLSFYRDITPQLHAPTSLVP